MTYTTSDSTKVILIFTTARTSGLLQFTGYFGTYIKKEVKPTLTAKTESYESYRTEVKQL